MEEIPRRQMTLFFVVDTSTSMRGKKIASVNEGIREIIPIIRDLDTSNADATINIAALQFATDVNWMTPEPIHVNCFEWSDLKAKGWTALGAALAELNSKMSRAQFLNSTSGSYAPVVIFLSDGGPGDNWKKELARLKENPWFSHAIKIAIAIGDKARRDILAEITGSDENVLSVNNIDLLKELIRIIAVTSLLVGSSSSTTSSKSKQESAVERISELMQEAHPSENDDPYSGW